MIKVIDGHRYNADKSVKVAMVSNFGPDCYPDDAGYWERDLFVTQAGYYFEYTFGQGMSKFGGYSDEFNCYCANEFITPVDDPDYWIDSYQDDEGFWKNDEI